MRVPKETSSQPTQPTQKVKVKPELVARPAPRPRRRPTPPTIRARTKQEDHVDGPRRLEGGITTPNGVAQVDPGYRNLNPTPPAPEPKYGKR